MKNKILALVISAFLLIAVLTANVFAAGETLKSGIFSLTGASEGASFQMSALTLPDESVEYIETVFDKFAFEAEFVGAYTASLTVAGEPASFTNDMTLTLTLGSQYNEAEVFLVGINAGNGSVSAKVDCVRNGSEVTVSGEKFAAISGDIIVVMASTTAQSYIVVPAAICAGVAVIAIIVSVVIVKKKASKEGITD